MRCDLCKGTLVGPLVYTKHHSSVGEAPASSHEDRPSNELAAAARPSCWSACHFAPVYLSTKAPARTIAYRGDVAGLPTAKRAGSVLSPATCHKAG